jgi:hypothetical protein
MQSNGSDPCDSSFEVGGQLPHRVNSTYICGVNPFTDRAVLEKCCTGPITNITSPAPKSGPLSDSWPVTCLAYCAILLKPKYNGEDEDAAHNEFIDCLDASGAFHNVVCTEVNGYAPNECVPLSESVGCTDGFSHSTWDGSTYISGALSTTGSTSAASSETASGEASSTTAAGSLEDETRTEAPSPTESSARQIKPLRFSTIIAATLLFQAIVLAPLMS